MAEIADAHYALVLRELARFAKISGGTLRAPAAGSSTFQLTGLNRPTSGNSYREHFEGLTGGSHGQWQSPSFSKLAIGLATNSEIAACLKRERGVVRTVNAWRWKWHQLQLREEALMWSGLLRLRVARERWWDRAWGELVFVEEPGRSFAEPLRVGEQGRAIKEFLRVFASLSAEVELGKAIGAEEYAQEQRALTAEDEWVNARSVEITVKVLGEIAVSTLGTAVSAEEVMNED